MKSNQARVLRTVVVVVVVVVAVVVVVVIGMHAPAVHSHGPVPVHSVVHDEPSFARMRTHPIVTLQNLQQQEFTRPYVKGCMSDGQGSYRYGYFVG